MSPIGSIQAPHSGSFPLEFSRTVLVLSTCFCRDQRGIARLGPVSRLGTYGLSLGLDSGVNSVSRKDKDSPGSWGPAPDT